MGKLIVIEGTDGSGKSTQFKKLTDRITAEGIEFQKLVFPQYAEPKKCWQKIKSLLTVANK